MLWREGVLELKGFVFSLCKALVHEAAKLPCLWMSLILVKYNRCGLGELGATGTVGRAEGTG